MAPKAVVPAELTRGPFSLEEAKRAGLKPWHLQGSSWRRLGTKTYVWAGVPESPMLHLQAVQRRLPTGAAFSGSTAAWLHGLGVEPGEHIHVTVPCDGGVSTRSGIAIRRSVLPTDEVVLVQDFRATSIVRTLAEVCGSLDLTEAVALLDSALHNRRIRLDQMTRWTESHSGRRDIRTLRRVISLAEPAAESLMESRLRMVLVLGGLPRPKAQVPIHDRTGAFVGRPDLYYEYERLGIEYDGRIHHDSLVADNRRQNRLLNAGVRLLRFTAADVLRSQTAVVSQVRSMLHAAA